MARGYGDVIKDPAELRRAAAEARRLAEMASDITVKAELEMLAATYLRDAAKLEALARSRAN